MPEPGPTGRGGLDAGTYFDSLGGVRGLVDSALPATVFVVARLVVHGLAVPIVLALLAGAAVGVLRRLRGQSLQQAGSGLFGLVIAVVVARVTGTGEGFFLPGIVSTGALGVVFALSALAGRPAVAYALTAYDPRYGAWPDHPALRRAFFVSTWFWAVTFFLRAGVAYAVYSRKGDNEGLLLVVINAVKWPLIAAAVVVTVALVKRAGPLPEDDTPAAPGADPVEPVRDGAPPAETAPRG